MVFVVAGTLISTHGVLAHFMTFLLQFHLTIYVRVVLGIGVGALVGFVITV